MEFIETSAKNDLKVYEAFELIAKEIVKNTINKEVNENEKKTNINISQGNFISNNKKKCCNKNWFFFLNKFKFNYNAILKKINKSMFDFIKYYFYLFFIFILRL